MHLHFPHPHLHVVAVKCDKEIIRVEAWTAGVRGVVVRHQRSGSVRLAVHLGILGVDLNNAGTTTVLGGTGA